MKRSMTKSLIHPSGFFVCLLLFLTAIMFFSCGDDATSDHSNNDINSSSYAFSLSWPEGTPSLAIGPTAPRAIDCTAEGVDTIVAHFYNADGGLLKSPPDEFPCAQHAGRVDELPPGSNYHLWITGENASGIIVYQGERTGIDLVAGQVTYGNEIPMSECISEECNDGIDNDCDRQIDCDDLDCAYDTACITCTDSDSDTFFAEKGCGKYVDCNDNDDTVYPGAVEVCDDGKDNDCNGNSDCYDVSCTEDIACPCTDFDTDTYYEEDYCVPSGDCDDNDVTVHPGASEVCDDDHDNDCDGNLNCYDSECTGHASCSITNTFGMTFNLIAAGTFTMGSPDGVSEYPIGSGQTPPIEPGRDSDEGPPYQVTLTQAFYLQTTEVTQEQWDAVITAAESQEVLSPGVLDKHPSEWIECGIGCPVEQISWDNIQIFISALNQLGEGTYSLPTEAQWEYAARAGSTTAFANGIITDTYCGPNFTLDVIGWYCHNSVVEYPNCLDLSSDGGPECAGPNPVAQKDANAWGLFDMHGNVWEWCQDWYGTYPIVSVTDPTGPESGDQRVRRSGSWYSFARHSRSASRAYTLPDWDGDLIGFRLLRQP